MTTLTGVSRGCLFQNMVRGFGSHGGLRFGPDARLYCVARDEVVVFDFETGECLGAVARLPRLNGQAVIFFP
jgi:hypothetical protein